MMDKYDLHCHSTASDGALTPTELVKRAHQQGVTALSLTDHDTTNGLAEAQQTADDIGIRLIPGIELSSTWEHKCFHIVGLGIDPDEPSLLEGIEQQQIIRAERAKKIALKLEKKRIPGAYDAVREAAGDGMITRSHFASYLLEQHHVRSQQEAFDKYLGRGKPAYVSTVWAGLEETIAWIKSSGGVAVLAHPLRYKLTSNWMNRALTAFKQAGGQGIEVVTGRSSVDDIQRSHFFAQKFQLRASQGSDFHTPSNEWVELGRMAALPDGSRPIWELLN
ncbi:PHP domain-containing protein [Methylomarinum sp. Ch1-1]|uniref:PHP domain-containing protein n=1 Tax=Methylomarinum roseum TaxID=3067653 RepID=A0AAU7P0A6_9GAMM|nr:PHP domain-containing protein [Methylomarinum sp. Ch1-1]MDP4520944.1 PHP domain-containing protein [Methylomarinum sp. Ch1-1]